MEQRPISLEDVKVNLPSTSSDSTTEFGIPSSKRSLCCIFAFVTDLVNHILIACLTLFLGYYSFVVQVDVHVLFCSLGYVLLMSEGIVALADESISAKFLSRRGNTHVHWVLQVLGLICIVAGVGDMYRYKTVHYRSVHALLGISSVIIMIILTLCGYPVFIAGKLRKLIRPVIIKFGHNFLGICCFVLGMASQCYGYKYNWLLRITGIPNIQVVCIIVTAIITILSVRSALPTLCRQFTMMLK
ncbi:transmembrane reductase CYB561D2 [Calliopsis andreniformis]|uniref:transmembrane reductase CYB561D2 n=1 Tax=Calliopsis andreniformis TaxID=337506 RepID=UPI003FCD2F6F